LERQLQQVRCYGVAAAALGMAAVEALVAATVRGTRGHNCERHPWPQL
jgi:hypothetical protein